MVEKMGGILFSEVQPYEPKANHRGFQADFEL
jgi:hypothetical protein